jgi:hypothetical protein
MFFALKNQVTEHASQLTGLIVDMFFIKLCDTAKKSLNDFANTGDMAEGLMTAFNLQNPLTCGLGGQGVQMVLALKITLVHNSE